MCMNTKKSYGHNPPFSNTKKSSEPLGRASPLKERDGASANTWTEWRFKYPTSSPITTSLIL